MSRPPRITGKQLIGALKRLGFEQIRIRGSHCYLRHPDGRATVVPAHAGETIGPGLLSKVLRDAEISKAELSENLWRGSAPPRGRRPSVPRAAAQAGVVAAARLGSGRSKR